MAGEQLIFDILARDAASAPMLKVGQAASSAADSVGDLNTKLTLLNGRIATARVQLSGSKEANAALDALAAKMALVGSRTISSSSGLARATSDISAMGVALDGLTRKFDPANLGMTRLGQAAAIAGVSLDTLNQRTDPANKGLAQLGLYASGAGGWFSFLTSKTQLFGGALTAIGVPSILAAASGLHLIVDAAIETAAVIIPAAVAFTAFGVAAAPVAGDIYNRMLGVFNVSRALNETIYPMSGQFVKLATAVQPQVYQLFGEALVVINSKTSEFQKIAVGAGQALDQLGARAAAALTSGGLSTFLANAVPDLAKIGDIVGNIFGTIGNLLRTLPGYAQTLLGVLDGVTRGLEAVTASPITQWLVGVGLAMHGAVLYLGLGATAAVFLGNALVGLAAKFGLATEGALAFDAVQFGAGLSVIAHAVADAAVALVTFSGAEDLAAAGATALDGAFIVLGAVNPLVWVGAAAAGIGFLVYQMLHATSATQDYVKSAQAAVATVPVSQAGVTLLVEQADVTGQLTAVQQQMKANLPSLIGALNAFGSATGNLSAAQQQAITTSEGLAAQRANDRALLPVLESDERSYADLLKVSGGNLANVTAAGVTWSQWVSASKSQRQQYVIEIQAAADAFRALALGSGRSAAAIQAETSLYNTETIPALQKLTAAEGAVLNVILGAPQAFLAFEDAITGASARLQTPAGLAGAASVAGAKIGGLNAQSQALANSFYSYSVPAAQKMIDALQMQSISTAGLTTAVATEVGQMLPFTKGNIEARSVLVDLINGALGPGTVSLQTLNGWVHANSTTLQGFNKIVAESTVAAGNLATTLSGLLNVQFHNDILEASGADKAVAQYTRDLVANTQNTAAGRGDRAQLIRDLENSGLSAKQAAQYVDNMNAALNKTPKTDLSEIIVKGRGTWTVTPSPLTPAGAKAQPPPGLAAGGLVTGGIAGRDSVAIAAMPGEVVVPASMVSAGAVDHLRGLLPGFAGGGVVSSYGPGSVPGLQTWAGNEYGATVKAIQVGVAAATYAGIQSAIKAAIPTGAPGGSATPGLMTVARYIQSLGGSAAAAAGVAGVVAGESGGDPEAVQGGGGGGMGLIQWTPGSSARPYQPIITGNAGRDMAVQLVDMAYYIGSRGGLGRINAAGAAGGPMSAAWVFSGMEAPAVPGSDIRPAVVAAIYAALTGGSGSIGNLTHYDTGGLLPPGLSMALNTTGRAEVIAGSGTKAIEARLDDVCAAVEDLTAMHAELMSKLIGVTASGPAQFAGALSGAARTSAYKALYS